MNKYLIALLSILLIGINLAAHAQGFHKADEKLKKEVYKFTQPDLVYALEEPLKGEVTEERAKAHIADSLYAARWKQGQNLAASALPYGLLFIAARQFANDANNVAGRLAAEVIIIVAWLSGVFEKVADLVNSGVNAGVSLVAENPAKDALEPFEVKLVQNGQYFGPYIRNTIGRQLYAIRTGAGEFTPEFRQFLEHTLNIPRHTSPLNYDTKAIEAALSGQSDHVQTELKTLARRVVKTRSPNGLKTSAFFLGEPGTGKSQTAMELLDAIGMPYCLVALAGKGPSDFLGTDAAPGEIASCLIQKGTLTVALIIDDADRVFSPEFLSLLLLITDALQKSLRNPYFKGESIDISHMLFIFTGNSAFSTDAQSMEALEQRILTIHFDGFSTDYKTKIALKIAEQLLKRQEFNLLNVSVLSDIEQLAKSSKDRGMRSLKEEIEDYLTTKALEIEESHGRGQCTPICRDEDNFYANTIPTK